MKNQISSKAVQHGLETFWMELPQTCDLNCAFCFIGKISPENWAKRIRREQIFNAIDQAKAMGVDSIGFPGAGEPFLGKQSELTMDVIRHCDANDIFVTMFTTGLHITEKLAKELIGLRVELMVKGNSLDPDMQDLFVSNPSEGEKGMRYGYGVKRSRALDMLMSVGFNKSEHCEKFGRRSRLALVTSIMQGKSGEATNYAEMADILRFCRNQNIIFDCDTILERGRGIGCSLSILDQALKEKLLELQHIDRTEYPDYPHWDISQSYVGTVCDRFRHHMYMTYQGEIHPCIGSTGVRLGNIRTTTLKEAWASPEMQVIRNRCYGGVCGTNCANFAEGKCNSCLGRRAVNLTSDSLKEKGFVDTVGCWNNRPTKGGE